MDDKSEQPPQPAETENKSPAVVMKDYTPEDREKVLDLYHKLSATADGQASLQSRFGGDDDISYEEYEAFVLNDTVKHTTLVLSANEKELLGLGQYIVSTDSPDTAEMGILIVPDKQGLGIGTNLILELLERCRKLNPEITKMQGITRSTNYAGIRSLNKASSDFGGKTESRTEEDDYNVTFSLKETAQ